MRHALLILALTSSTAFADPVATLQAGSFAEALREAEGAIAKNKNDAGAHAVRALARYRLAGEQFMTDATTVFEGLEHKRLNGQYLRFALTQLDGALRDVDAELAAAARDKGFALDLCLACWQVDWNRNGRIDARDQRLFEVEIDADGNDLPEGDARRRPTFRFDVGDLWWARAMVGFQSALVSFALAYRWSDLEAVMAKKGDAKQTITIHVEDKGRLKQAREQLLAALDAADAARKEYLAEKDDEREWVPNPRQRSHPLPLPVDELLYKTWEGVIGDVRRLVKSQDGLPIGDLMALGRPPSAPPGTPAPSAPRGSLDLGRIFSDAKDIVLVPRDVERLADHLSEADDAAMRAVLGSLYVPAGKLKPTPLLERLRRMAGELARGEESLARKLRYLLWLN